MHVLPLVVVTVDWCLSSMRYEWQSVWINLAIVIFYGLINLTVTKVSGEPIYPPFITWDSPVAYIIGFALLPVFAGVFVAQYYATKWKLSKMPTLDYGY